MAITVQIKHRGIRRDATSAEVIYIVEGTDADKGTVEDADAYDAVAGAAPGTWAGIPGANIDVREELVVGTFWLVAVTYGDPGGQSTVFPQSTIDYEFSFQAPSEKIYQSLETIGAHSAAGDIDLDWFGGAINVKNDNGELSVEGLDMPGGSATSTWVYKPLNATITDAYQNGVEAIMGDVNSFAFKGRPAGTMRFVSCDGGAMFSSGVNPKWAIRFGFQFSRHRSSFSVGGIDVAFKGGHHLLWGYYEDDINDGGANPDHAMVIKKPKFVFVERVFNESNFGPLGIG